jgi:hypothetical protein
MAGYPNDQGAGYPASIPMWQATQAPTPDAQGRFPTDQSNPNAAIPVYEVPAPVGATGPYPNDQGAIIVSGNGKGAMPVRLVARPSAQASYPNDPANDLSAKPMWVVASETGVLPVYPSEQDLSAGAIPIYIVTGP